MRFDNLLRKFNSKTGVILSLALLWLLGVIAPAQAHHMMGGRLPQNAWEGFISGLAHPVIGLDHLAFVIAMGLLASAFGFGGLIVVGYVLATLIGTGLHLQEVNLPFPETIIGASVLLFGVLIVMERRQVLQANLFYLIALVTLSLFAGIFHGYAYGEAIVGAETTPLTAYLLGFMTIQGAIALGSFIFSRRLLQAFPVQYDGALRSLGFTLSGMGLVFLTKSLGL